MATLVLGAAGAAIAIAGAAQGRCGSVTGVPRFPVRATAFAAETPPVREVLADSRTMKGGGAAGVATLGAAGVEAAQSVLAETQSAILPLVPYRHAALGVHRCGARRHRGHDLRPAR